MTNKIIAVSVVLTSLAVGCDMPTDKSQFNREFFPTNHWKVVGQGTNGQVIVETGSANVLEYLRVHEATPVAAPMTNGQSVVVKMTVRRNPLNGAVDLISSVAYPAAD